MLVDNHHSILESKPTEEKQMARKFDGITNKEANRCARKMRCLTLLDHKCSGKVSPTVSRAEIRWSVRIKN